jgi:hypothetical protein
MEGAMAMDEVLGAENGANWGDIIVEAVLIRSSNKLNSFLCVYSTVLLALDICDAQTKRRRVSQWCGDGVGVLGLGTADHKQRYGQKPLHTMVGQFFGPIVHQGRV